MRGAWLGLFIVAALGACAPRQTGNANTSTAAESALSGALRAEPSDFAIAGHREVKFVYALTNSSRRVLHLDFPTAQHVEFALRGPSGERLFLWSEDRSFAASPSSVIVNPGERLEFEAGIPTRDMVAGRTHSVEAVLPGYPATAAAVTFAPR